MPGPNWSDDDPADVAKMRGNIGVVVGLASQAATARVRLTLDDVRRWHAGIYAGCSVPSSAYVGNVRGDPSYPDLLDYEVGVGPRLDDGFPERVGVWSAELSVGLDEYFAALERALALLDAALPSGSRPSNVYTLREVVELCAVVHGEWVRLHPFANGNGRTARLLAAHIALRYGLPVFVTLQPRPHDVAYVRASKSSMGRPPHFSGNHDEAIAVVAHTLSLLLMSLTEELT